MVNTGRPSPACKACRARRLKCDQTKPTCIKCTKAKRVCPGYRDAFEVNFKDQTESVIRRHERSSLKSNKRNSSHSGLNELSTSSSSNVIATSSGLSVFSFEAAEHSQIIGNTAYDQPALSAYVLSLEKSLPYQASCYFMSNFVNVRSHSLTGSLRFLNELVGTARESSTFHAAFLAVSMAALASRPNPGALVSLARSYYNKALVKISKTMSDKVKSKEDQSLAAIIMLIFYEVFMWEDDKNSLNFHINGAQAITRLRGPGQRKSPLGNAMFEFLRGFIIHQYAHAPEPNVDEIMWWVKEGGSRDQPNHVLQGLNVETTVLRKQLAEFLRTRPDSTKAPIAFRIFRKAKKLEAEVRMWFETTGDAVMRTIDFWQPDTTEETIHLSTAYPGRVYTFDNMFIAVKYLSVHLHWLMLAEIMANTTNWIQTHCDAEDIVAVQRAQAVTLAHEQISQVISIAPYFCKWPTYNEPSPFGAMTCGLPLYAAGSSPFTTKKQRAFLAGRLRHLSAAAGLKSSARYAAVLKGLSSHDSRFHHPKFA